MPELSRLIGHTPLIQITYRYADGPEQQVLVKCEQYNLTGSIKDRVAHYVLQKAMEQEKLRSGDYIIVSGGGNCAASFAAIGKALGHRVKVMVPETTSLERRAILKNYGAEIVLAKSMAEADQAAEAYTYLRGVFLTQHLERLHAEAHELFTGREIGHALLLQDTKPQAFVAGVGSGATLTGVGNYLQKLFPAIRLYTVVTKGKRIDGINHTCTDPKAGVLRIEDGDAILMAQKLAAELQLGVGISSGANLLSAIRLQQQDGANKVVVTVFPDDNKKYASTDLFKEEPRRFGYFAPEVKLISYQVLEKS